MVKEELIQFETKIGDSFNRGEIKAPIHLYHGNEDLMISLFNHIDVENDWVCCTWRNHYQGLLKGIPPKMLEDNIPITGIKFTGKIYHIGSLKELRQSKHIIPVRQMRVCFDLDNTLVTYPVSPGDDSSVQPI
jgi:hypothetical protein